MADSTGTTHNDALLVDIGAEDGPRTITDPISGTAATAPAPAPPEKNGGLGIAAVRGTSLVLGAQLIRFVFQFVSLVVLARLLSPQDFGVVASVTAIIGIADILRDFGLSSAAIQAKTLSDDEQTNLFWVNLGLGIIGAVVTIAATPLIELLYGSPALGPIVLSMAGIFVISGANTQFDADLTRNLRFKATVAATLIGQVIGILMAIALAFAGAGYWAIIVQQIATAVIILALNIRASHWRPGFYRRDVPIRRFFRFGGGVFGTQLIAYATKNVDNVAVGAYLGASALGFYSRAYQLLLVPLNQINAPLTQVALPILSRVQDDDEAFTRYVRKAQIIGCYVTATVFALFTALSSPIVAVLFGPRWHGVVPIFAILALGGIFRAISQISYWIYLARGKTAAQLRLYLYTRPAMIAMILGGLPWGAVGVATGCSIAYTLYWVVSLLHVGHVADVDGWMLLRNGIRSVLLVSAPCGLAAFGAVLLVQQPILQLVLGLLFGAAYVAVVARCVPVVGRDLGTVWYFAKKLRKQRTNASPAVV